MREKSVILWVTERAIFKTLRNRKPPNTHRITIDGHDMRMIGGHHDESVLLGRHLAGLLDSRCKLGGVLEGSPGVSFVVGHVDAGTLDEEEESLLVATQDLDGRLCELTQRRIRQLAALPVPIAVVGQVIVGEETQEIAYWAFQAMYVYGRPFGKGKLFVDMYLQKFQN